MSNQTAASQIQPAHHIFTSYSGDVSEALKHQMNLKACAAFKDYRTFKTIRCTNSDFSA